MQILTQYEYLDRDMILKGVVEWIVKESPILQGLPMKTIQGNSFKYNVETALPTASWLTVGTQIAESSGTFVQRSSDIYTLIQDVNTDKSAIALNATQDPEAIDIALGAKAMAHEFERAFIVGRTTTVTNALEFEGILKLIAELESTTTTDLDSLSNSQVIAEDATSGALTMEKMDELIDAIKPGKPDLLIMSRRSRRKLNALQRASGAGTGAGVVMTDPKQFGAFMPSYDNVPIHVSDWILDNYPNNDGSSVLNIATYDPSVTRVADYDNTVILALQLAEDKVTGLHAGEMKHEREEFVEDYNAIRNRFVWYVGLALLKKYSAAVLIGCNPTHA